MPEIEEITVESPVGSESPVDTPTVESTVGSNAPSKEEEQKKSFPYLLVYDINSVKEKRLSKCLVNVIENPTMDIIFNLHKENNIVTVPVNFGRELEKNKPTLFVVDMNKVLEYKFVEAVIGFRVELDDNQLASDFSGKGTSNIAYIGPFVIN